MTGEAATAQAMRKSVDDNARQMLLTHESRELLTSFVRTEVRDEMRLAVSEGITAAMTAENARTFVHVVVAEAQAMATAKTGEVVGNAVWGLVKRGLLFLIMGSLIYKIGGWALLAKVGGFFAPEVIK